MTFNTIDEIIDFLHKKTDYQVNKKGETDIISAKNYQFIYTGEGREMLKKKGYFDRRYIFGKLGQVFNQWHCEGCQDDPAICKKCRALKTIIKSL